LEASLTALAARGDLMELKRRSVRGHRARREFAIGRLNLHRDGYGF
jgi:hypothetical protein